ncbi:MAG: CvpA family protein [Gammaproteobacteria bacterium]|nr:CvpA family protein [Gammaproteobacteria bacterium]
MTWVDYGILAVIGVSALVSLVRGFVREAFSLASWVAALWIALAFFEPLSGRLAQWISIPSLRLGAAFAVLFLAVLLLGALIGYLAGQLVQKTGLTGTDRVLGMVFGFGRGMIIVAVLVLLAGLTAMPRDPWWSESQLLPHFQHLALWLRGFLPGDIAARINY